VCGWCVGLGWCRSACVHRRRSGSTGLRTRRPPTATGRRRWGGGWIQGAWVGPWLGEGAWLRRGADLAATNGDMKLLPGDGGVATGCVGPRLGEGGGVVVGAGWGGWLWPRSGMQQRRRGQVQGMDPPGHKRRPYHSAWGSDNLAVVWIPEKHFGSLCLATH
jgi:hypothetical protein